MHLCVIRGLYRVAEGATTQKKTYKGKGGGTQKALNRDPSAKSGSTVLPRVAAQFCQEWLEPTL